MRQREDIRSARSRASRRTAPQRPIATCRQALRVRPRSIRRERRSASRAGPAPRQGRASRQQPRRQRVIADAAPTQAFHQHDFQKTLQDHFLAGTIGSAFVHDQVDDATQAPGVAVGRANVDHAGQQRDQERRVDHFDPEGAAKHLESRARLPVRHAERRCPTDRDGRSRHPAGSNSAKAGVDGSSTKSPRSSRTGSSPSIASQHCPDEHDRETRQSVGRIANAPLPAPGDRLRHGGVRTEQGDDVAERIHFGRSVINIGLLIIERPERSVYPEGKQQKGDPK